MADISCRADSMQRVWALFLLQLYLQVKDFYINYVVKHLQTICRIWPMLPKKPSTVAWNNLEVALFPLGLIILVRTEEQNIKVDLHSCLWSLQKSQEGKATMSVINTRYWNYSYSVNRMLSTWDLVKLGKRKIINTTSEWLIALMSFIYHPTHPSAFFFSFQKQFCTPLAV